MSALGADVGHGATSCVVVRVTAASATHADPEPATGWTSTRE